MKKSAFSLAEVLVTLALVGVIAALTIPMLTANLNERKAITALKKGVSVLSNAARISWVKYGMDYYMMSSPAVGDVNDIDSFFGLIANSANIDRSVSGPATYLGDGSLYAIFLADGSAIIYSPSESVSEARFVQDGEFSTVGFNVYYDINGKKGPNILSNCRAAKKLEVKDPYSAPPIGEQCENSSKRVVRDIFKLKIQEKTVLPNDPSSAWVMSQF